VAWIWIAAAREGRTGGVSGLAFGIIVGSFVAGVVSSMRTFLARYAEE
jgi:hypothetical protein